MIEISATPTRLPADDDYLSAKDLLAIAEENRARLRTLSEMVLTICGLLLSASFVVLFFVLQQSRSTAPGIDVILLFACAASLTASILFSVLSACLPSPTAISTVLGFLDHIAGVYRREYRRAMIAVVFLVVAILLFALALVFFALKTL